jgi:hypothetical protein
MGLVDRIASLISGDRAETRARGRRLAEEHAELDSLLGEVRRRADIGEWQECDVIWRRLCTGLEDHFRFEEQQLWPEFALTSTRARSEVDALILEHADIRAALDQIALEIELKRVDRTAIERLIAQVRAHASHEHELFYPWASARPE